MSDAGNNGRDEKGRLLPGNSVKKTGVHMKARKVSRGLKAEMVRRYQYQPLDPDNPGEPMGKERAVLKHYFALLDIMQSPVEKAADRIKAASEIANRIDGKPVQALELMGAGGGPVQSETLVTSNEPDLSPAERLALAIKSLGILAQHGGIVAGSETDSVGGVPASGNAGAGDGGSGGDEAS